MKSEKGRQFNSERIKEELLSELDSFLLEADNDASTTKIDSSAAREMALREIDRLIKQELSFNEIANILKKNVGQKKIVAEEKSMDDFYSSIHVVDLRGSYERKASNKKSVFSKLIKNEQEKNESTEVEDQTLVDNSQNIEETKVADGLLVVEKRPTYRVNYRFILRKTALVALTALLALLPVQGFVFVSQLQKDKDRLIDYSSGGFLSLKSGIIKASGNSYQEADIDFVEALDSFNKASDILNAYDKKFLSLGQAVPVLGNTLKSGENILAISASLSQAATVMNRKASQSADLTEYIKILDEQLEILIPLLSDTEGRVKKLTAVPESYRSDLDALKKELPVLVENLRNLKIIIATLEELLGSQGEKRYLLLFQNNNELRPSGGFIGSYALVDVNKGKIVQMEVPQGGTYDLTAGIKHLWRAPQALSAINPTFNIWDANWWPDFPSSAKKISTLFNESGGTTVDGVVAINATVLQKLLSLTGPIYLEEYNYTIDANNIYDVLQNEIENKRDEQAPKAIISDLAPKVLDRVLATTQEPEKLLALLSDVFFHKDVQIFSLDKEIDQNISNLGWRSEMFDNDRDYLWVVNTNIGGGKTDLGISQLIEHQAEIQNNGEIIDTVTITRSNQGSYNNPWAGLDGGNVSYLRFFVPLGSKLLTAQGFDHIDTNLSLDNKQYQLDKDLASEEVKLIDGTSNTEIFSSLNRTVFANWQTLKPGETKTISISYKLPFRLNLSDGLTNDWKKIFLASDTQIDHYSLLMQKQSGQSNVTMSSKIILPTAAKVIWKVASDEDNFIVQNNIAEYTQELVKDQYFGVVLAKK